LLLGQLSTLPVVVLAGRIHYYEGYDLATVTHPIRVLAALGVRAVVLTNAAGGIRQDLKPGDLVMITDHLNLMGANPLRAEAGDARFVDLSEVYSPSLRALFHTAADLESIHLKDGVYAAVSGPSYETPAEVSALGRCGTDLVGMSTVPEAIVARRCGLEVAAVSCVTNRAAGVGSPVSHDEVLATADRRARTAGRLLARFAMLYAATRSPSKGPPDQRGPRRT
jgi:purine-nucleoside phosphorylase